jgi:hypothetical protein
MVLFSQFSSPTQAAAFIAIILLLVYAFLRRLALVRTNPHNLPYPPGPKPWPGIGNIFEIASSNQAEAYQDLAKRYGQFKIFAILFNRTIYLRNIDG